MENGGAGNATTGAGVDSSAESLYKAIRRRTHEVRDARTARVARVAQEKKDREEAALAAALSTKVEDEAEGEAKEEAGEAAAEAAGEAGGESAEAPAAGESAEGTTEGADASKSTAIVPFDLRAGVAGLETRHKETLHSQWVIIQKNYKASVSSVMAAHLSHLEDTRLGFFALRNKFLRELTGESASS